MDDFIELGDTDIILVEGNKYMEKSTRRKFTIESVDGEEFRLYEDVDEK